jgi:hypothetical protein
MLTGTLLADSVTLKSGEKIEGKIIRQTDTEVAVEVKVSASITDERVVSRADIQSVDAATEDESAFAEIKAIRPNPDSSVAPETYEAALGKLRDFAEKYPLSPNVAAVKETVAAFEAEQKRVQAGEIKVFGKWLAKEEAEKRKYQIQAQMLYATMRDAAGRGDFVGALNTFDALERSHSGAAVYPDAAVFARQLLNSLAAQIANSERNLVMQKEQLDHVLAATQEPKKTELLHRMAAQAATDEAVVNASRNKWKPFIPRSDKSLAALKQTITGEASRLGSLQVQKMRESLAATEAAKKAFAAKDFPATQESLKSAVSLWSQNEEAAYWTKVLDEAKLVAAKATPTPAAKTAAAAAAEKAAAEKAKVAAEKAAKKPPFYMTLKGSLIMFAGLLVLIGVATLVNKAMQSRAINKEGRE